MLCPLPHVLALLNSLNRFALRFGEAPCRAFVRRLPACLPRALLLSCPSRLAARLSTHRAKRLGDGCRLCLRLRRACGCHADVVRRMAVCSSVRLRPVCLSPRSLDTVGGEVGRCRRCLLLSDFYRLPFSSACEAGDGLGLLACSYVRRSFSPCDVRVCGFCGSRLLRLPGLLRHGILSLCRRGRMNAIAVYRNSLACFSIPIAAPLFNSSPSSTPIAATGVLLILSLRPIAHGAAPFDALRPVRLLDCGERGGVFLCLLFLR